MAKTVPSRTSPTKERTAPEPRVSRAPKPRSSASEAGFVGEGEFRRVRSATIDPDDRLILLADMARLNALTAIQAAGAGDIGSCFSAIDILTYLYHEELDARARDSKDPDRDLFLSSKGHDAPAWYAVLHSIGHLDIEALARLGHPDGLSGQPDVRNGLAETTGGSLGMGLSKAKGLALAKRLAKHKGRVLVLAGDGELQEGQNYEALLGAAHLGLDNLVLLVDHNEVQTDQPVSEICDVGYLEDRLRAFGWVAARCDGHDVGQLREVFAELSSVRGRPVAIVAETIKGSGVSFMEHPKAMAEHDGIYPFRGERLSDDVFQRAASELEKRVNRRLQEWGMSKLQRVGQPPRASAEPRSGQDLAAAFGAQLLDIGRRRRDLVVLDADAARDCHVRAFASELPDRFFECGIAEQDMVSTAGGFARGGFLPVVTGLSSFVSGRAQEQIFANACDGARVVYAFVHAGLVPGARGVQHQSVRDIALLGSVPDLVLYAPSTEDDTSRALTYAIDEASSSFALRLPFGMTRRLPKIATPEPLREGQGTVLERGDDVCLVSYGPTLLHETLAARELLREDGIHAAVVAMPWLNRVDEAWFRRIAGESPIVVIEDHASVGGLGDRVRAALGGHTVHVLGVDGLPLWGSAEEVLAAHGLDAEGIARAIRSALREKAA